jgi:transcriptional regulator with XRE-family HTH domain/DNA-binding XRE family transcriptional regulator
MNKKPYNFFSYHNMLEFPIMKELAMHTPVREKNGALRSSDVVFDRTIHGDVSIPSEVRRAGTLVAEARGVIDVSQFRLARLAGVHQETLNAFESGTGYTELAPLYDVMSKYLYERDASMEQLERYRNNQAWFRTFAQPGMTTGDQIELMCLADWKIPGDFARKAGYGITKNINNFINDRRRPTASKFNDFIDASVLDPDSKAAQFARLQRSHQLPMSLSKFSTAPVNKIARYLRHVYGLTASQLGEQLHYSESSILAFEKKNRNITAEIIDAYAHWLGLPENSPLLWSLRFKTANPDAVLPDEVLPFVFEEERLLFKEHVTQVRSYPMTPDDRQLLAELQPLQTAREKLQHIKQKYHLPNRPNIVIQGKEENVVLDNIN